MTCFRMYRFVTCETTFNTAPAEGNFSKVCAGGCTQDKDYAGLQEMYLLSASGLQVGLLSLSGPKSKNLRGARASAVPPLL